MAVRPRRLKTLRDLRLEWLYVQRRNRKRREELAEASEADADTETTDSTEDSSS